MEQVDMFLSRPNLELSFNESKIPFGDFYKENDETDRPLKDSNVYKKVWEKRKKGDRALSDICIREEGKNKLFTVRLLSSEFTPATIASNDDCLLLFDEPRRPNKRECCCIGTFPQDYNFLDQKYNYVIGMSVPPLMTARLSNEIYNQWLKEINEYNTTK